MIRLDKYLANNGHGSRREVKGLIRSGAVSVNGTVIFDDDFKFEEVGAKVEIEGNEVDNEAVVYVMLNKPKGYVSATRDNRDPTVTSLVPEYAHLELFPVGRLDKDTEGLMILTNDGAFAHDALSPKNHVPKTYLVTTATPLTKNAVKKLSAPMEFEEFTSAPATVKLLDGNDALITICEGKYHQIKRMVAKCDNEVIALKRVAFGNLKLPDDLTEGQYRKLAREEVEGV